MDEYAFGSASSALASAVTRLNLNNNELTQYELAFLGQLGHLKELMLDYNKIERLPDNMFANARHLEHLSLKGNFIAALSSEHVFAGLHFNLRRLNLASNKIRQISPRVFTHVSKLKELNVEKNFLGSHFDSVSPQEVINTFEGVESELKYLNLEHNQVKPAHLWSLVNLLNVESLRVGHNLLGDLELTARVDIDKTVKLARVFEFYRNLTYLDMQNSSVRQMPYFVGLNRTLLSLNLAQNRLCHVHAPNLRRMYARLRYFNLNANPLSCDCHLTGLRTWIDDLAPDASFSSSIVTANRSLSDMFQLQREPTVNWKCASPSSLFNKQMGQLSVDNFICETNR